MAITEYAVTGMTCANCERHVSEEVESIPGATVRSISHESGRLSVETEGAPVDDAAVLAAVEEAGYRAARA